MTLTAESTSYFYGVVPVLTDADLVEKEQTLKEFPIPHLSPEPGTLNLENEEHGNVISNVKLLLNQYTVEKASNGNAYLKITFSNSFGSVSAKMWDNNGAVDRTVPLLDEHALFFIHGKVEEFPRDSGKKSLTITKIEPDTSEDLNPFSLLPCTEQSLENLTVELYTYLNELDEPHRTVGISGMKRFWNEFVMRPAAKGYHHNYLGGLLKHTVGLMRIARFVLDEEENYFRRMMRLIQIVETEHKKEVWNNATSESPLDPRRLVWNGTIDHLYSIFNGLVKIKSEKPNKSLLICSIFYHDLGKLMEYTHAGKGNDEFHFLYPTADMESLKQRKATGITMDPLGALVGHMPYGVLMLAKMIESENISLSIEDIHHYNHCILSHHGKHEWQSTVVPATSEAFLLHFVDYLDSRYEVAEEIK